jgi:predicted transposase/invertase (TIGR01784 family)
MTLNIHDSGYKKLFSNRTIFRQLIETFIHEAWVKDLNFEQCETIDKSFISDHYKATESDLIYKIRLKGKLVYIYILLEFQSKVDRFMGIRVLNYLSNFYLDYIATQRAAKKRIRKLPAIFPIVLYNGKRQWTAKEQIAELIEAEPSLGAFALHFQYLLINERTYSKEQLLKIRNIVSTLFLAEGHYDINLLETELLNLYDNEADKQAVSLFLNWFRQLAVHGKVPPVDYARLDYVYRTKEEVHTMLVEALAQERKNIYQAGVAEGKVEGKMEGEVKGQQEALLTVVESRFQLTAAEYRQVTEQIGKITDGQILTLLLKRCVQAATLAEFLTTLTEALPKPPAAEKP